jgi:hypothetical protein
MHEEVDRVRPHPIQMTSSQAIHHTFGVAHLKSSSRYMVLSVIVQLFLFASCAKDPVAIDLVEYVNRDILNISQLEVASLESYASVTGPNYTSDQALLKALQEFVVPNYGRFLKLLRDVHPVREEIIPLHRTYIRGAEHLYSGFKTLMLGVETQDAHLVEEANRRIEEGRVLNQQWRRELLALYEKHGIKQK